MTDAFEAYFKPYFSYVFQSDHDLTDQPRFDNWYVDIPESPRISQITLGTQNSIFALTGLAGSGKTTQIKKHFGLQNDPHLMGDHMIIPFAIDNFVGTERHNTVGQYIDIRVGRILTSAANFLFKYKKLHYTTADFVRYVIENRPTLIWPDIENLDYNHTNPDHYIKDLKDLSEVAYGVSLLKFALARLKTTSIVIIADDLESASHPFILSLIPELYKIRNCLINNGDSQYSVKLIISCRKKTFHTIRDSEQCNGYPMGEQIDLSTPPPLKEIFERRFKHAIQCIGEGKIGSSLSDARNLDSWDQAKKILFAIFDRLSVRSSRYITALCNHNVRDAFNVFRIILSNSRWYLSYPSHTAVDPGAFRIEEMEESVTEANIIRSLVLGKYKELSSDSVQFFFNPFHSTGNNLSIIFLPYLISILYNESYDLGFSSISNKALKMKMESIFPRFLVETEYQRSLDHLRKHSAIVIDSSLNIDAEETITALPRLYAVWHSVKRSSICLELFKTRIRLPEYPERVQIDMTPCALQSVPDRFLSILGVILYVGHNELALVNNILEKGPTSMFEYKLSINSTPITDRLLNGAESSIHSYFKDEDERKAQYKINALVSDIRAILARIYRIVRPTA